MALARFAMEHGARSVAAEALREARRYEPDHRLIPWLERKIAALPPEGTAAPPAAVIDRRKRTVQHVVAELDRLTRRKEAVAHAARFEGYLWDAFRLDPGETGRLARLRKLVTDAARAGDAPGVHRLLIGAATHDPEGTKAGCYRDAEAVIGRTSMLRVKAPGHLLEGYVMLPPKWSPERSWPIAVYIDGAASQFEAAAWRLRRGLNATEFILVVPITLSNANELRFENYPYPQDQLKTFRGLTVQTRLDRVAFDAGGLAPLLDQVRKRFRGETRFFLTGYSGGGFLVYWWLHHHPDQLAAVAPASANYAPELGQGGVERAPGGGPPVHLFTGSNDAAGTVRIFPQNDRALATLERLGFTRVTRSHLEGRGHEPFTEDVFGFFSRVRAERGKQPGAK